MIAASAASDESVLPSLVSAASVLVGLLVGLGSPLLVSAISRRSRRSKEQHQIAHQILELWEREEVVHDLLVENLYLTRRMLLLLGNRLRDRVAREACLYLVRLAAQVTPDRTEVVDAWSTLVKEVGRVYRDSA
jgi:hypothetical protein